MAVPGNTQVAAGSQPFRSAQDFINICNTTASRVMCIDRVFFSLADAIDWACQNGLFRSKLPATAGDVVNKYYDEIKDGLIGSVVETWGHEDNIWAQAALDRSNPRIRYHEEFFEKHGRLLDQQHPDDKVARYRILISPVIMLLHIRFQILGHRILDGCYANMPPTRDPSVRPETVYLQGFTPFPLDPMDGDERGEVMWLVGFFADMALEDLFYGVFDMREPLSSHSGHPNLPFTVSITSMRSNTWRGASEALMPPPTQVEAPWATTIVI
ncbi:hypothetical protein F5Y15DRAFT_216113 [Xylariaceae sp. FL0016]|nr:hypothetical protein F5Y15DRAFT_216113 [Xylariaceae sp. FL0016]